MPRKLPTYNQADVESAIKLMQMLGKTVTAVKFHPDGTFRVMTAEHVSKAGSPDNSFDQWKANKDAHPA